MNRKGVFHRTSIFQAEANLIVKKYDGKINSGRDDAMQIPGEIRRKNEINFRA